MIRRRRPTRLTRSRNFSAARPIRHDAPPAFAETEPELQVHAGAFVTLKHKGRLRGCLGQFKSDQPLWKFIADMARSSSYGDTVSLLYAFDGSERHSAESRQLEIVVRRGRQKKSGPAFWVIEYAGAPQAG